MFEQSLDVRFGCWRHNLDEFFEFAGEGGPGLLFLILFKRLQQRHELFLQLRANAYVDLRDHLDDELFDAGLLLLA